MQKDKLLEEILPMFFRKSTNFYYHFILQNLIISCSTRRILNAQPFANVATVTTNLLVPGKKFLHRLTLLMTS